MLLQLIFDIPLVVLFSQSNKIKYVRILQALLSQISGRFR